MRPERRVEAEIPEVGWEICGDRQLLKTAILNLLDNAIKFSPADSSVQVLLSGGEEAAVLRISDQGKGIPAAELEMVFDKYYRGSGSSGSSGAGIGLHLVRRIIEQCQGQVSLAARETGGITATVVLPLLKVGEKCR